jgi:hypothetical protein
MPHNAVPYAIAISSGSIAAFLGAEVARFSIKLRRFRYGYLSVFLIGQILLPPYTYDLINPYRGNMPGWGVFFTLCFSGTLCLSMLVFYFFTSYSIKELRLRYLTSLVFGYLTCGLVIYNFG